MIDIRDRTCSILDKKLKELYGRNYRCKNKVYAVVKVRVFWRDTNRHSWQTWYLCKEHYEEFMESEGKGWYSKKKDRPKAFVVDFKIL